MPTSRRTWPRWSGPLRRSVRHAPGPAGPSLGGDDDALMAADMTSAFNCRTVSGTTTWSTHAYGTAVDINPVENPYVRGDAVQPSAGRASWTGRTSGRGWWCGRDRSPMRSPRSAGAGAGTSPPAPTTSTSAGRVADPAAGRVADGAAGRVAERLPVGSLSRLDHTRSSSARPTCTAGPISSANARVPSPSVPPSSAPPVRAEISISPRMMAIGFPLARWRPVIRPSRGSGPCLVPRYRPDPTPTSAMPPSRKTTCVPAGCWVQR